MEISQEAEMKDFLVALWIMILIVVGMFLILIAGARELGWEGAQSVVQAIDFHGRMIAYMIFGALLVKIGYELAKRSG